MNWFSILCEDEANMIRTVSQVLKIPRKEVSNRIARLDIDDASNLIDAVTNNDTGKIANIMSDKQSNFMIGDDVEVDEEEGVVKKPEAPNNTVGVLINGELKMVDKKNVKALEETVLGMTGMPGFRKMMELAKNLDTPSDEDNEDQQPDEVEEIIQVGDQNADDADEGQDGSQSGGQDIRQSMSQNTTDQDCPLSVIMSALDQIESVMPELKVSEFKRISDRIARIQNMVFESTSPRRKKRV